MTCDKCKNVCKPLNPDIIVGVNNILIVGESPKGQLSDCLASPTFKRLSQNLAEVGVNLFECSFTEICKCELLSRSDFLVIGRKCIPKLIQQIETYKPKTVITLGVTANELFSNAYGIEPKMGELVETTSFKYLPLWHTSPINPKGLQKNRQLLSDNSLTFN